MTSCTSAHAIEYPHPSLFHTRKLMLHTSLPIDCINRLQVANIFINGYKAQATAYHTTGITLSLMDLTQYVTDIITD